MTWFFFLAYTNMNLLIVMIIEKYPPQGGKWFFFTPRNRKYKNGSRPDRKSGDGYWKATGAEIKVKDTHGNLIGYKRQLVFYKGKAPDGQKTSWIMHEFTIPKLTQTRNTVRQDSNEDNSMRVCYLRT